MVCVPALADAPTQLSQGPRVTFLDSPAQWQSTEVLEAWKERLAASDSSSALFQSPAWLASKSATKKKEKQVVACLRDGDDLPIGVAPLAVFPQSLRIGAGPVTIWNIRLRAVHILGEEPLLPEDSDLYDRLFTSVLDAFPEADSIHLGLLRTDSFCWRWIQQSRAIRERFLPYVRSINQLRLVDLPGSFEAYLRKFKSKKRYNLSRQVRLLREHGGGVLELRRITRPEEVAGFLQAGSAVARNSWQDAYADFLIRDTPEWRGYLEELAGGGMLRCYLLMCGLVPCAYVLGFQGCGCFHYNLVGFDEAFRDLSPGTVMLYLMIDDLIGHDPPRRINFGFGDNSYKREFANAGAQIASVVLFRKTVRNRVRKTAFAGYRSLVEHVKRVARRRGGQTGKEE